MCKEFDCEFKGSDNKCNHKNHFTIDCLGSKCEAYACCCMCKKVCENSQIKKV